MSNSATSGRPLLIVVSSPSGGGKSTLCDRLLASRHDMVYSVSCTTRPPRGREVDGLHYHFLSESEFERRAAAGDFLEHAVVHGARYGTLRHTVEEALRTGRSVLMDIDVQGAAQIRSALAARPVDDPLRSALVDIFIAPPSLEALERRLVARGEDTPESIACRMRRARQEMTEASAYRYRVVNEDLEQAHREMQAIIEKEANQPGPRGSAVRRNGHGDAPAAGRDRIDCRL